MRTIAFIIITIFILLFVRMPEWLKKFQEINESDTTKRIKKFLGEFKKDEDAITMVVVFLIFVGIAIVILLSTS